MKDENAVGTSTVRKRVLRALLYMAGSAVVLLLVAHLVWKYSGSNTWQQTMNRNGIQVYSKKVPGSSLEQFKAVTRVRTTMNRTIGPMVLSDLETCAAWVPGCNKMTLIQPWNARAMRSVWMWRIGFGPYLKPREFLLKTTVTVDLPGKMVQVENTTYPDELPRDPCCYRVEHMRNIWHFSSLGNGEIQVEVVENMDVGMPYFMFNSQGSEGLYEVFATLPTLLNDPKYQNARFDFADAIEPPRAIH